ncbi:MAG: AI-2E family transporter [Euryarchaeota archaeon]|nr:AI-2E family transporter [Euryarchaeota archaeon]
MKRIEKMALALLIIIILTAVIVYATLPYLNYFFGAFILYIIFRPLYHFFVKRGRIKKQFAAALVIIISIFVVLIPLFFLMSIIIGEVQQILLNQESIIASIQSGGQFLTHHLSRLDIPIDTLQTKLQERVMDIVSEAVNYSSNFIMGSIQSLSHQSIGLLLMYFLFYYLLIGEDSAFARKVYVAIPFNEENTATLMDEFNRIVRTTITSSGAVAIVQGSILTITFLIFKIQGAILWGFIATIVSFVPVFGSSIVWVPAVIIQFLLGNYTAGVGILATGLFISVIDNVLRPIIQKKVGEIHPFLSLLGIIIGVSLFGLIGIVIGPLLLSYFLLTIEMFSREYLS